MKATSTEAFRNLDVLEQILEMMGEESDSEGDSSLMIEAVRMATSIQMAAQVMIDQEADIGVKDRIRFQSDMADRGALDTLARLARLHQPEAWLAIQTLLYENKRTCALFIRDGLYEQVCSTMLSHGEDVTNEDGELVARTEPPSQEVIAAAFVMSTLVVHNRQHTKMITPQVLRRCAHWIEGRDSAATAAVNAMGRNLTLQCRAISIARDLTVNAAMHDILVDEGIGDVLAKSIALETIPRRKVASIISVCMLIHTENAEDGSAIMSISHDDFALLMSSIGCSMHDVKCYGESWRMWKLMLAVHKLSIKDENRAMMLDFEDCVVRKLHRILNQNFEMGSIVQRYALLTLWNLSFDEAGLQRIRAEGLLPIVRRIKDATTSLKTLEAAKGVLFQMGELNREREWGTGDTEAPVETDQKHIMISYEWTHQQRVLVLAKCLESFGYRVWLDIESMSGSTLEAMASAVEQAEVVICCISRKYKNSQACRTEAEYAFQQRKRIIPVIFEKRFKPTGWLGALMGTRLYFAMHETYQVQAASKRLALELGDVCKIDASQERQFSDDSDDEGTMMMHAHGRPSKMSKKSDGYVLDVQVDDKTSRLQNLSVTDWTPEDVKDWLVGIGMTEVAASWYSKGVNGMALHGLMELTHDGSLRECLLRDMQVRHPVHMLQIVAHLSMLFNTGHK